MDRLGQLLLLGVEGTKVGGEHELFFKETGAGGVILFKRNFESLRQLRRFVDDLQKAAADAGCGPLIVSVDQEGGRVARFRDPFTVVPAMGALGSAADAEEGLAFEVGRLFARELAAVGVNCDHAPVLDVATNPANPVIGDRSFSHDPGVVSRLACEFIRGMQGEGVAACGKHFPGHGDTDVDSHLGLPLLHHTRGRFDACELVPFRAAIGAGVASIMTAHLLIPNLDGENPATVSRAITTEILRRELRFDGLVFTDCLTMEGIAAKHPAGEAAWRAVSAGADVAVICHGREKQAAALEGLRRAAGEGALDEARLEESYGRIRRFKERFCNPDSRPEIPGWKRPSLRVIGSREHQKLVSRIG